MRPLTPGTLRAHLWTQCFASYNHPLWASGDALALLKGRPATFDRETLEGATAPVDRTVDLSTSESWVLTGDDTLTPA